MDHGSSDERKDPGGWETVRRTFDLTVATLVVSAFVYGVWILTSWWIHPG
ncbi:MAG: hypothetical protein OZ948_02360 [Deltaproteobacteria bacterium]|nr:hypothetical protein [Deltaproteobacteria bacterium]